MRALTSDPMDGFASSIGSAKDTLLAAIDSGREHVSDVDFSAAPQAALDASRSAIESARDAIPAGWPGHARRERSSRWPWVALILLGTTLLTFALLGPTVRRWTAAAKPEEAAVEAPTNEPTDTVLPADPGIAAEDTEAE